MEPPKMTIVLQRIGRLLKSKSGSGAVVQLMSANVLVLILNLATGVLTARLLGPEGRGAQAAIIMWPQFLAYLLALGLPSALLYNLKSRAREEAGSLIGVALVVGLVMGLISTVIGVLFVPLWLEQYSTEVVRFAQLAMLTTPIVLLGMSFSSAMRAQDAFHLYNRTRYIPPILTLVLLLLLVWFGRLDPFTSSLAYLVPTVPVSLWAIIWVWNKYHPNLRSFFSTFSNLFSYSLRSWGIDLLSVLNGQLDRILVVGFLEPAAMGLYVVALSLARILNAVQGAVVPVLFPKASGRSREEVIHMAGKATRFTAAVTLFAAVGLILLGPQLLELVFGTSFTGATTIFRLLVVETVMAGTVWVLAQTFMALDRPGIVTILQGVGVALTLPLLVWLVPIYGLMGAGLALLTSTLVRFVFICACFPLVLKVKPPRMWITPSEIQEVSRQFLTRR